MKKLAWIRSEHSGKLCPFGLPITDGCKCAGSSVLHMAPLEMVEGEEKKEKVGTANKRVYIYYRDGSRCLYGANIMEDEKSVNCDFGDTAQGMHIPTPEGSPLYPQQWSGCGTSGLYAWPMGWYSDNDAVRNIPQGLFSLVGEKVFEIIKQSSLDNYEVEDILDSISGEMSKEDLEACREKYDELIDNASKLYWAYEKNKEK